MPDQKISDLGDGGLPLPTDDFVVARGTTNNKLAWSSMSAAVHSSLSGTGAVSIATNGSTISIGVPAQTVQTQNAVDVTLSGNTAGALQLVSSGTLTLAGGNNITLSQAGNAVTISGANFGGAQTGISGLANSETTYISGTVSLSEQGAITIRSTTGQQFQFSVNPQSIQPETQTFLGGISASDTLYTSGTVRFTGVGGGVTVSSNTGQRVDISVAAPVAQSVQTQNVVDLTLSGNTLGVMALVSSGTATLAGGANITLSQVGNAISIRGEPAFAGTAISGIANSQTTYTSGTVSLSEQGAITIRSTTGNQFQFSVNPQSIQPETQTFIAGISASNTLYTSGNVRFTGSQAVTVRSGTGQLVVIDAPTQSVQAETQTFVAGIQNSQTTYTSGTVNLSVVAGNLTIRSTTGQAFQFSMSQTVQAETQTAISGIANSQTTYTSGTVSLSELGAITIRSTTGNQYQFSVNSQTNQAGSNYAIGNTFGTSSGTHDARTLSIAGDGIISVAASNSGWRISASQSVQAETQTFVGGIGNSQTTYTSGTVNLSVVAGQLTIRSTTGNAFQFSASQSVQAETQTAVSGIANSQTTYTSGTVSLSELGAITIRSTTGNQYQFSVNSQTVQTQNVVDVTLSGNTAGAMALVSSGTLTLAGGNNITLSQAGNAVTISGANVGGAQTAISGLANSETTYTSGTVSLSALGALTIRSTTGQQFQFSVNAQSVQPETQTFIAGVSASDTLYTSGNVRFTGVGGGVTVSSNTGQRVDISVAAQSVQPETQTFIGGISASNTLYTSGSVRFTGSQAVTVRSGTGQLVVIDAPTQSVQPETQTFVAGISASDTLYTSGNVRITGVGGGVTVSSNTGQRVDISVAAQSVQPETQTFVGGIGNSQTTYTSGTVNLSVVAGQLTIRSTTGNAFQFSASQSVQAETQTAVSGIANSQTTYTSGTVSLSELGAITIRSTTGNQFQFSVNSQTVQTQNVHNVTLSGNSTSAGAGYIQISSGTLTLAGGNNVTLSQNGNAVTISAGGGAETQTAVSGIANSQTTYTSGTVSWSELGAVTVRSTTGNQFQISVNAQTAQTGISALYDGANSISSGTVRLTNANGVTFSINGNTLSGSVNESISMFAVSNTTQSTSGTAHKSALSFRGMGIASVGVTGGSVVISVPSGGGAGDGGVFAGVSTMGNTAGSTGTVSTGNVVLVGTGPISLSQSTGAAGSAATISINAPATSSLSATGAVEISTNGSTISIGAPNIRTMADWQNFPLGLGVGLTNVTGISKTPFYWNDEIPAKITANSLVFRISQVTASQPNSFSVHLGIYTLVNSTSAALLGSLSETYVVSSASSVSFSNVRNYVISGIGTHTALSVLSGGDYMFGMMFSATATNAMNFLPYGASVAAAPVGVVYPGVNQLSTGTSQGVMALYGRGSSTVNVMPANVVASELINQGVGASMQLHPWIYIRS